MRSHDSVSYYDHHAFQLGKAYRPDAADVLRPFLQALSPHSRVIDLGCGVGNDLRLFGEAGHEAHGLDASKGMVAEAQKASLPVQCKNFLLWSPKAHEWDGVWANRSFQHCGPEELQRVVACAFRGLSAGGVLGMILPEGSGAFEDREGDIEGPSRWIHPYSENQICSMIEQTGFKVIQLGRRKSGEWSELLVIAKRIDPISD